MCSHAKILHMVQCEYISKGFDLGSSSITSDWSAVVSLIINSGQIILRLISAISNLEMG